jgi:hypothetical protein
MSLVRQLALLSLGMLAAGAATPFQKEGLLKGVDDMAGVPADKFLSMDFQECQDCPRCDCGSCTCAVPGVGCFCCPTDGDSGGNKTNAVDFLRRAA